MKFLCVCMSPAIDATVTLPHPPKGEGEIFKDVAEEENVGGKTVNVARWLALRGADVACGGLLGEDNDRPFAAELAKYGIADRFLRVPGATRRNEMIVWPGGSVKLNRAAFPRLGEGRKVKGEGESSFAKASEDKRGLGNPPPPRLRRTSGERGVCEEVLSQLSRMSRGSGVAILSGSLPPAIPKDFYARAVAAFKAQGWQTVLDASGEAMRLGLAAGPDLIKPNAEECEPLVGFVPKTPNEFARATAMLREKAAHVVISDGGAGAWFDGVFVPAPKVEVVDTTAAGDTLLAEFCWRFLAEGLPLADAGRWAVAAGSAACTMPGGAPPALEIVAQLGQ